jgi:hypothetical protein
MSQYQRDINGRLFTPRQYPLEQLALMSEEEFEDVLREKREWDRDLARRMARAGGRDDPD